MIQTILQQRGLAAVVKHNRIVHRAVFEMRKIRVVEAPMHHRNGEPPRPILKFIEAFGLK